MTATTSTRPTQNPRRDSSVDGNVIEGSFVKIQGQDFYQIQNYDKMPPFLMSLVSAGDHWMYVSSTGGLTAGRVSAENCLFPYEAVDRLHDCYHYTGPITLLRPRVKAENSTIWQPFCAGTEGRSTGPRRLLKNVAGDQIIFEETNQRLKLVFRYSWRTSTEYGFVRTATLENIGASKIEIELVDGLQNIFPSGVPLSTYQYASCLVDAYKHNEVDPITNMGIYSLTAQIIDRAEAAEVLRATTVWSRGLAESSTFLSRRSLSSFYAGTNPEDENLCTGQRGNYFTCASLTLTPGQSHSWYIASDVGRDHQQIAWLRKQLLDDGPIENHLETALGVDHQNLLRNVASADGLQATGSQLSTAHHFANVLFNNMRGGVFADNYLVESADFLPFITARNRPVAILDQSFLQALPEHIEYSQLLARTRQCGNPDLVRLALEYLPLTFSRRHGDPSRPWNAFEIHVRNDDGSTIYSYQGNWRDIFQNWEALSSSFPVFLPSMVSKFVNASTVDGYNPYRITNNGIDWEVPDPDDPRSNIGYWGDHQIIYLTKLLEALGHSFPAELAQMLENPIFCFANTPYRIKSYEQIVANSCMTIDYDLDTAQEINCRVEKLGTDGKLMFDSRGQVYYVNLIEKLLIPILAKLSNFAVDGGIWLNTQRPEWNDANNALVGSGLSMVTVCYLRRHLNFVVHCLQEAGEKQLAISTEVEQWFRAVQTTLQQNRHLLREPALTDVDRGRILEESGSAFSAYRLKVYDGGLSGKHSISSAELIEFFRLAVEYLEHSIHANRRADGLYHAYNLLELQEHGHAAKVSHLYEMLEGQVAVLSSGVLNARQAVDLVHAMFESKFYLQDQRTFMLYPKRELPGFLQRNQIPATHVQSIKLLCQLIEAEDKTIVTRDLFDAYHFNGSIEKQTDLIEKLDQLARDHRWSGLVAEDRRQVLAVFEEVFHHKAYTGRSGTMYGYEGLGCIYWHMVSKLLLAVQENVFDAMDRQAPNTEIEALTDAYYRVRDGLGSAKTPAEYGAFPTDPYSHTPQHSGAQQPGMTGQVKEEILTRQGELGLRIKEGRLRFQPLLLCRQEFLEHEAQFEYFDPVGKKHSIELLPGSLAFTVCQVPVVYQLSGEKLSIGVTFADGRTESFQRDTLDAELSLKLFQRTGQIRRIDVHIPAGQILRA